MPVLHNINYKKIFYFFACLAASRILFLSFQILKSILESFVSWLNNFYFRNL